MHVFEIERAGNVMHTCVCLHPPVCPLLLLLHTHQLLEQYFGKDDELDPAGAFLKSYIANKAWKDNEAGGRGSWDCIGGFNTM